MSTNSFGYHTKVFFDEATTKSIRRSLVENENGDAVWVLEAEALMYRPYSKLGTARARMSAGDEPTAERIARDAIEAYRPGPAAANMRRTLGLAPKTPEPGSTAANMARMFGISVQEAQDAERLAAEAVTAFNARRKG